MTKTADVIVIGSGVIGCAAAYYMAKRECPFWCWIKMKALETAVLVEMVAVSGSPDVTRENCRLPFMV
mgnify:CR=1 FL=1